MGTGSERGTVKEGSREQTRGSRGEWGGGSSGTSCVWNPSVRLRCPAVSNNRLAAKPPAFVKKRSNIESMWQGGQPVSSQQIKAGNNISRASLWRKAKAGKKSLLFPWVLSGEE